MSVVGHEVDREDLKGGVSLCDVFACPEHGVIIHGIHGIIICGICSQLGSYQNINVKN